jgi:hypothetical protein
MPELPYEPEANLWGPADPDAEQINTIDAGWIAIGHLRIAESITAEKIAAKYIPIQTLIIKEQDSNPPV